MEALSSKKFRQSPTHLCLAPLKPRCASFRVELSRQIHWDSICACELFRSLSHQHHMGSPFHDQSCERNGMSNASDTGYASSPASAVHYGGIQRNNPVTIGVTAQAHAVLSAITFSLHDTCFSSVEGASAFSQDLQI